MLPAGVTGTKLKSCWYEPFTLKKICVFGIFFLHLKAVFICSVPNSRCFYNGCVISLWRRRWNDYRMFNSYSNAGSRVVQVSSRLYDRRPLVHYHYWSYTDDSSLPFPGNIKQSSPPRDTLPSPFRPFYDAEPEIKCQIKNSPCELNSNCWLHSLFLMSEKL